MTDDLHIEREITLEESPDEVWPLVGSADGWQQWLVDVATIELAEGAEGEVVDDGVARRVSVTRLDEHAVTFRWWEHDDPSSVSEVSIRVEPVQFGGSRLVIRERPVTSAVHACAGRTWDMRLCVLALSLSLCTFVRA